MIAGNDAYAQAAKVLLDSKRVTVAAHLSPDGDAVGSTLGLVRALTKAGVHATAVLSDPEPPAMYDFLPGYSEYELPGGIDPDQIGTLVALDTPTVRRLGDAVQLMEWAHVVVAIDHHIDSRLPAGTQLVDDGAAATAQIVWRLLPHLGVAPDAEIATCLYTGLVTDTGRFQYSNTNPQTMRDGAALLEAGADALAIATNVYESQPIGMLSLIGRTLSRLSLQNGGAVAYSWIDEYDLDDTAVKMEETENLIDLVRSLGGVDVVFLAKIRRGEVRVSLRAKDAADVGSVAREFGGGGHRAAAGFTADGTLEQVVAKLLPLLPER